MKIETDFLEKCNATLSRALDFYTANEMESIERETYRSACIKEFEIILEQSGKLLRKCLKLFFHSSKEVDRLVFKDVFRNAVLRSILTLEEAERWMEYRNNRNNTAHDYGVGFAEDTLLLLPQFIIDSKSFVTAIKKCNEQYES